MTGQPHIVSVNQDRGISPQRRKGAAIHLAAMRDAFRKLGAAVSELDVADAEDIAVQLKALHKRQAISLVYERYALGRDGAARFARVHGIPYVLEVNAPLAYEQARWRGLSESESDLLADRLVFSSAAYICAVSSQVAEYVLTRGGRPHRIHVCPNGIDTALFNRRSRQEKPQDCAHQDRFVIGFHGRERPWHRFDLVVDLVRNLRDRGYPAFLSVVGSGDFKSLEQLPKDAFTRVDWVAHERLPSYLRQFDALPLSYAPDSPCYFSPLKLMEGMACGVVPVVPDLGDLPQIVEHESNGLVYPAGDMQALAGAMISLISHPELRERLSSAAALTAEEHDWTNIAAAIMAHTVDRPQSARMALAACR